MFLFVTVRHIFIKNPAIISEGREFRDMKSTLTTELTSLSKRNW